MAIKLIIFDLDGTLVDSLDDLTDSVNQMRAAFAAEPLLRSQVQTMVGQGARSLVERALPGLSAAETDRALVIFLAHNAAHLAARTTPYPGIPALLAALQSAGVSLAVVSNKNAGLCRQLLQTLGLADFFAAIYGADSFAERKPSPLPFLEVMRLFNVAVPDTMVVGDSSNDVLAARAAGLAVIGCGYGYGTEEELVGATFRVAAAAELLPLLQDKGVC
jgi:phosphoglycolate phosphatase